LTQKHNLLFNSLKRQEIVTALPKIQKIGDKVYLLLVARLAWTASSEKK
jgi:hypothetical protein